MAATTDGQQTQLLNALVRLDVCNFKSYRGLHTVGPFHRLTAVIGPNGAGKSNLMDAISFVLGVNATHLRSGKLKHLINSHTTPKSDLSTVGRTDEYSANHFSQTSDGSDNDPEAALGTFVSAFFCDLKGILTTFMRTISKTGHSDYKIDAHTLSREKYIQRLAKHNILANARNFLVFQGDVEAVASQCPRDLTTLVEQVSGSLDLSDDYLKAKAESLRANEALAVEATQKRSALAQHRVYADQKEKLVTYESLINQRDNLQRKRLLTRLSHIDSSIEKLRKALLIQKEDETKFVSLESSLEMEVRRARQAHALASRSILLAERAAGSHKKSASAFEMKAATFKQKKTHAMARAEALKQTIDNLTQRIAEKKALLEDDSDLNRQLAELQIALTAMKKKTLKSAAERQNAFSSLDENTLNMEYQRLTTEYISRTEETQTRLDMLVLASRGRKAHSAHLNARISCNVNKQKNVQLDIKESLEILAASKEARRKAETRLKTVESDIKRIQTRTLTLGERLRELEVARAALSVRLLDHKVDKREIERLRAFNDTVAILQGLFPNGSVLGALGSICRPSHERFALAISIAIGRNMNSIVCDTKETAVECIRYLREQRAGHATFLPLSDLQTKNVDQRMRTFPNARPAIDVITYDKRIEPALLYACSGTIIAENLDVARSICYGGSACGSYKAVSLDGITIHKSGQISAGFENPVSNPFSSSIGENSKGEWEVRNVDEMKRENDRIVKEIQEISIERRMTYDLEELAVTKATLITETTTIDKKIRVIEVQLNAHKQTLETLEAENLKHSAELKDCGGSDSLKNEETNPLVLSLQKNLQNMRSEVFSDFCSAAGVKSIEDYEKLAITSIQKENKIQEELSAQIVALESTIAFEKEQLKQLNVRKTAAKQDLERAIATASESQIAFDGVIDEQKAEKVKIALLALELEQQQNSLIEKSKTLANRRKLQKDAQVGHEALINKHLIHKEAIKELQILRFSELRKAHVEAVALPFVRGNIKIIEKCDDRIEEKIRSSESISLDYTEVSNTGSSVEKSEVFDGKVHSDSFDSHNAISAVELVQAVLTGSEEDEKLEKKYEEVKAELENIRPNSKAGEQEAEAQARCEAIERNFEKVRLEARELKDRYMNIRSERHRRFMSGFTHMAKRIDEVYKELTRSRVFPMGGTAYLSLESEEEPFDGGIRFHAMPPMKRFRDMEQLSGGEKTVAALALLFSVHSYRPAPFFVLDEIDAALDNANVGRVARYLQRAGLRDGIQFIVISLKGALYDKMQALIGVCRDGNGKKQSSRVLTLDLTQYGDEVAVN